MEGKKDNTAIVAMVCVVISALIGPCVQSRWISSPLQREQRTEDCTRERFELILDNLEGFFARTFDPEKISIVTKQYRLIWMCADDRTISAMNDWFLAQGVRRPKNDSNEWMTASMVLAMRRNLRIDTSLKEEDFLLVVPSGPK